MVVPHAGFADAAESQVVLADVEQGIFVERAEVSGLPAQPLQQHGTQRAVVARTT